jgi:hypothetical protein
MNEVKIIVSGPVGCGKSALLGEIEILMKALGIPVRYQDDAAAQAEKRMTHADWQSSLEMYEPSVVLVEDMPWLRKPENKEARNAPADASDEAPELTSARITELWDGMPGGGAGFMKQWGYYQFAQAVEDEVRALLAAQRTTTQGKA